MTNTPCRNCGKTDIDLAEGICVQCLSDVIIWTRLLTADQRSDILDIVRKSAIAETNSA